MSHSLGEDNDIDGKDVNNSTVISKNNKNRKKLCKRIGKSY